MVKETKFYDTFGVSPDAPIEQIKKVYKKLALKHHPDRNPDNAHSLEVFKTVSYHFSVLEDPEKRRLYDRHGEQGLKDGHGSSDGMHGFTANDIFSQFFGAEADDDMGGFFTGRDSSPSSQDTIHELGVSLEQLYMGCSKKLAIQKNILCKRCEGKGGKRVSLCRVCGGRGVRLVHHEVFPGMVQQVGVECDDCQGTGKSFKAKDRCKFCHGERVVTERKVVDVYVDPGMRDGSKVVLRGEGDQVEVGVPAGDVVVIIREKEHDVFRLHKEDLLTTMTVELVEALCGFTKPLRQLDGRLLLVNMPPGQVLRANSSRVIANEGFPQLRHIDQKGRLIIHFDVIFPQSLSLSSLPLLKEALGPLPALPTRDEMEEGEIVQLESEMEEDSDDYEDVEDEEEDVMGGQPGCAQQ